MSTLAEQTHRGAPRAEAAKWLPILRWLPAYNRGWLRADVIAGLTLWGLVAPEAMAYAGIAGLPPQAGLYTLLVSLLIYALMGTSRHLSVGPTSASSALIASTVATVAGGLGLAAANTAGAAGAAEGADGALALQVAAALVMVVGAVFLLAGLARLGFITQFLSRPVMDGFVTGLALFVAIGQLNKLFGVERVEGNSIEKLLHVVRELPHANWVAFAVGAAALALLALLPRLSRRIPSGLVVLFGLILISTVFDLHGRYGVEVVGSLPQGLPRPALPRLPLATWAALILPAVGIVIMTYAEALAVAREFAEKHRYEIDPDQELKAYGVTNAISGLFGGQIGVGGMSASAVKEGAGAHSQVANLVAWVAVLLTVLFLTPLFTNLPEAVLAALIIHAVWHLITARKLKKVRLLSRSEFWLGALTLAGVLFFEVLTGMVIGLVASLLLTLYNSSRPHVALLGRTPARPDVYSDLERHPENQPVPGVLIVRLDAPLYFANALSFRQAVAAAVARQGPGLRAVVLHTDAQDALDITSAEVLEGLVTELHGRGLAVLVAELHAPVRAFAERTGLLETLGAGRIFATLHDAVQAAEHLPPPSAAEEDAEAAEAAAAQPAEPESLNPENAR